MQMRSEALAILCPMHLLLDAQGYILQAGPTIAKVCQPEALVGKRFLDVFDLTRPRAIACFGDLQAAGAQKLHLKLRAAPHTALKGVLVHPSGDDSVIMINLSFGISIIDAVRDFELTNADFAATDLAIEMLYLVEAKTAAMSASYLLNMRLQGARIAAEEQAYTDTLTGLKNRRGLEVILSRLLKQNASFAVMQIDLDYFKAVNDTLGHAAGDFVLQTVAQNMVAETREQDVVARVGGDEFTVVLSEVNSEGVLRKIGQRIIERVEKPIDYQGHECRISASIGTVWIQPGEMPEISDILSDADVALYASKNAGRAMQTLYSPDLRKSSNLVGPQTERRQ
jgi:diguanylate cyclase (GGDEF)-like protein